MNNSSVVSTTFNLVTAAPKAAFQYLHGHSVEAWAGESDKRVTQLFQVARGHFASEASNWANRGVIKGSIWSKLPSVAALKPCVLGSMKYTKAFLQN